ncbi:Thioredoxin domain-containing protein [Meloidogyne graminicola]|uniref:Thioredoxin domain-containing protein n=1 Tax=Meloidogyne graminicola TaxID=189291 RepID=A0A8S9ZVY1_9BILA|nr:Thioredoxin domain-containing protein [Meloidogyne graminicola]
MTYLHIDKSEKEKEKLIHSLFCTYADVYFACSFSGITKMFNKYLFKLLLIISLFHVIFCASRSKKLLALNEENWRDILSGEWMIEFSFYFNSFLIHAPWCPACKDLQKAWNSFADWSTDLNINVAEIDVTSNPGLSGRFLVTALPTIYHVKDGVFRLYVGPRDKNDFSTFIEEKQWTNFDPIPSYKYPDSLQMGVVAIFFKLSMAVRDLHNHMVEKIGVPSWASYALFAGLTLSLGCVLGFTNKTIFIIVCIIDYVFPTGAYAKKLKEVEKKKQQQKSSQKDTSEADSSKKADNKKTK